MSRQNRKNRSGVKPNYTEGKPGEKGEERAKYDKGSGKDSPKPESKKTDESETKGVIPGRDPNSLARGATINDPEWYSQDPSLLDDSAKLNFSDPFGQPLVLDTANSSIYPDKCGINMGVVSNAKAIQGICSLIMKHSIGLSLDRNDPANVAASAFYSFVRYVNSGRKNYDPADLMLYALMVGDLYAFIQYLKRLYGYAFLYSQTNQYIGKALLEENGVDANDMLTNLANFRYFVNAFINKVSSFVIPSNIPYFSRRRFMYDGLYIENPYGNLKDQLYQFVPEGFFKFFNDSVGKGALMWTPLTTVNGTMRTGANRLKVADLIQYANDLISPILGDEDFGLMSGDILKAYGSNIMSLESLPEEYYVLPHYDMTVLSQFKNATAMGYASRTGFEGNHTYTSPNDGEGLHATYYYGNIYQDSKGNILCREGIGYKDTDSESAVAIYSAHHRKCVSLEVPNPLPPDNIEATRLTIVADRVRSTFNEDLVDFSCGVDYPLQIICRMNENYLEQGSPIVLRSVITTFRQSAVSNLYTISNYTLSAATQFKYLPTLYYLNINAAGPTLNEISIISNLDNYTSVDRDTLYKMHTCALLSLFFVPGVAKLINVMVSK